MGAIHIQLSEIALMHLSNYQAAKSFANQKEAASRSLPITDIRSYHDFLPKMCFGHYHKIVAAGQEEGTDLAKKMKYYSSSRILLPSFADYSSVKRLGLILFLY